MTASHCAVAFKSGLFTNEVLYFIYETNREPWFLRVRVVNSSACPKSLLYIPLRALTAFGKPLFSLNTLETLRMEEKEEEKKAKISTIKWYCVKIHLFRELRAFLFLLNVT